MQKVQPSVRSSRGWASTVAGVLVGAIGAFVVSAMLSREAPAPVPPPAGSEAQAELALSPSNQPSDRTLAKRVRRLEALLQKPDSPPAVVADDADDAPIPLPLDEATAATLRARDALRFEAFEEQPLDARWRAITEPALQQDLATLSQAGGFELKRIDCRSEGCLLEASWPHAADAREGARALMHEPLRVNCARTMQLGEETEGPGSARFLLDCASWKASGSILLPELPAPRVAAATP